MSRRVVVTGMGGVTALGNDWPAIRAHLAAGRTGVRRMAEWDRFDGIRQLSTGLQQMCERLQASLLQAAFVRCPCLEERHERQFFFGRDGDEPQQRLLPGEARPQFGEHACQSSEGGKSIGHFGVKLILLDCGVLSA